MDLPEPRGGACPRPMPAPRPGRDVEARPGRGAGRFPVPGPDDPAAPAGDGAGDPPNPGGQRSEARTARIPRPARFGGGWRWPLLRSRPFLGGCRRIPRRRAGAPHPAEESGFTEYTSYDNMMTYLQAVQASSTEMRLGIYGETREGRELPYAIFSRPAVTQPWEAWALGKPILVLAAGVHGPERTLRESVLIMTRELATPGTPMNDLLDDLVILVVPQINPDGFSCPEPPAGEPLGAGPEPGLHEAGAARDPGVRAEHPPPWAPHLYIDGHNGGSLPLQHQLPVPEPRGAGPADHRALRRPRSSRPSTGSSRRRGTPPSTTTPVGPRPAGTTGGTDPRIGATTAASPTPWPSSSSPRPGMQTLADGVRSGVLAYEAVVEWARGEPGAPHGDGAAARVEAVELGSAPEGEVPIEVEYEPADRTVTYQLVPRGQGASRPGDPSPSRATRS
jgi:hypothetical protein